MSSLTLFAENLEIVGKGSFERPERESRFQHRKRFPLTTRFRKEKVRVMREQLAEGKYDLDEHLDTIVDRLLAALNGTKVASAGRISI
jgi:hypothetical protein